jgi:hypothetical protein
MRQHTEATGKLPCDSGNKVLQFNKLLLSIIRFMSAQVSIPLHAPLTRPSRSKHAVGEAVGD